MPATSRRDELEARLERKIDHLTDALGELRTATARIEAAQDQARTAANTATLRVDGLEARVTALEASKHRAEGAAWAGKLFWFALVAGGGALGFALRHFALR